MELEIINLSNIRPGTELYKLAKLSEADKAFQRKTSYMNSSKKPSYDTFQRTTPRSHERMAQIAKRRKSIKNKRIAVGILGFMFSIMLGINPGVGSGKNNSPDTSIVAIEQAEEEARLQAEEEARLRAEEVARLRAEEAARRQAEKESRLRAEEVARRQAEEAARLEAERQEQAKIDKTNELKAFLEENPDIKEAYDNILSAVQTFSQQIGENGFELIKKYVEELGDGKVDAWDVYKLLYIESNGRIYDKNGDYLTSSSNAYGPFQIRKIAEIDINERYGTDYDVLDPHDNLAVNVLLLRWLNDYRTEQLEKGKSLPTGDNLKHAIMWGYHDGAYCSTISYYGQDYLNKYDKLSVLDLYPELYDLMEEELA